MYLIGTLGRYRTYVLRASGWLLHEPARTSSTNQHELASEIWGISDIGDEYVSLMKLKKGEQVLSIPTLDTIPIVLLIYLRT